jgi:tetratricopeptide (TPR) repeat protein
MTFRYWGDTDTQMSVFEPLVAPDGSGIAAADLHRTTLTLGWNALPVTGDLGTLSEQLRLGRPVVALIGVGGGRFHYVTVVGLLEDRVVFHDPAVSPYQLSNLDDFNRAWAESGFWTLLILPSKDRSAPGDRAGERPTPLPMRETAPGAGSCEASVVEGVSLARAGDVAAARHVLNEAAAACPTDATPLRELAALELREKQADAAVPLARRAVKLDPGDVHAWELLAASHYLTGDDVAALDAWNRVSPRVVDGLTLGGPSRTRQTSILGLTGVHLNQAFTARDLRLGRRRLGLMPAATSTRLDYRPLAGDRVEVIAAISERPLVGDVRQIVLQQAAGILGDRGLDLQVASPLGAGELWRAEYRWPETRRRFAFSLALPVATPVGGTVGIRAEVATETYAFQEEAHEDRRRTEVGFETWLSPGLRTGATLALDRWDDLGRHGSVGVDLLLILWGDRASVRVDGASWWGTSTFSSGTAELRLASSTARRGPVLSGRVGVSGATAEAPLMLWHGAGTGFARPALARAHPLLDDGRVDGALFGRSLLHGGLELVWWRGWGPLDLGAAAFSDVAMADNRPDPFEGSDSQVDVGLGLRIGLAGRQAARLDLAHGLRDGAFAVSAGMELSLGWR